jgi:CubicO group peptidase (beta-lactamase class C family)
VLRAAAGRPVLEFAEVELFRPLGLGRVVWYADKGGLHSGGLSALFRSRDILKLGELYLRHGRWHGVELIPPEYIAESVKVQNSGGFYGETASYGYMWWITRVAGDDAYYARGYGGQYLMVCPKLDLVILCTSDWRQPEYPEHFGLVQGFILPSGR